MTTATPSEATGGAAFESPWRPGNLLSLTGIKMSDYVPIETVADTRFLEEAASSEFDAGGQPPPQTHEKIPAIFTCLEEWPISTGLCCHECGFTFAGRPAFVPTYIRDACGRVEMGVQGTFCTWGCAELWIETRYSGNVVQQWRLRDNLCVAYRVFTGRPVLNIRPAVPKTELVQFGGDLDIDTWQRRQAALCPEVCNQSAQLAAPEANSVWSLYRRAPALASSVLHASKDADLDASPDASPDASKDASPDASPDASEPTLDMLISDLLQGIGL